MKARTPKNSEQKIATNFVAILGLVTEMARQVNENIAKVELRPLGTALTGSTELTAPNVKTAKV